MVHLQYIAFIQGTLQRFTDTFQHAISVCFNSGLPTESDWLLPKSPDAHYPHTHVFNALDGPIINVVMPGMGWYAAYWSTGMLSKLISPSFIVNTMLTYVLSHDLSCRSKKQQQQHLTD